MCRSLQKLGLKKKKHCGVAKQQLKSPKPQSRILEKVRNIEPENLVFLDEAGVLLEGKNPCTFKMGTRVYALKPFYRGAKVTVIGAISMKKSINDNE